jgi:hypothetical protein
MKEEKFQTLHPDPNKTNKNIALNKYNIIKEQIITILGKSEITHTELMEAIFQNLKGTFEGGVQWYSETVKLDLEARQIIERTKTKPEKYKLKSITHL